MYQSGNSVLHEVWYIQYTAGKILQQQELEKQKKQSEALNEITQEIGKCEETFCEQEEVVLGIIERTGQISVDNALQYVSDVKRISIYMRKYQTRKNRRMYRIFIKETGPH